jgi:predicted nucleic acid-binding protein
VAPTLTRDPLHARARATWEHLLGAGVRFHTSAPVVLETFTFLDRSAARDVALAWKDSLRMVPHLKVLPVTGKDLEPAWRYFERRDLHTLSAVDAVSFVRTHWIDGEVGKLEPESARLEGAEAPVGRRYSVSTQC